MINSLLVANRGALHVRQADEAVHIGQSPARESYLVGEKIIAAAKESRAEAIHPGYSFLAEAIYCHIGGATPQEQEEGGRCLPD